MRNALLTILTFPIVSVAQQPDWLVNWPVDYSLNPGLPSHVMASSPNGHLMSARLVTGGFAFGQDIFGEFAVERLDPGTGQALWTCSLGDSITLECGAIDTDGNVYVAGRFMGDLSICDGSTLSVGTSGFLDDDPFLLKFDPNGIILWSRDLSTVAPLAGSIPVLSIDPDGNAWYGTTDFILSRFARVDENGNDTETRFIDGGKTIGGLAFDPGGAMYVSGACDNTAFAFGGLNPVLPEDDFYLMFLARFRPDGTGHWARFAHDITFQRPDIDTDASGNVVITGGLLDSSSWGGFHLNGPDWGIATFVAKADSTGQFQWAVQSDTTGGPIEGDLAQAARRSIGVDANGQVFVTGTLRGEINWGSGVVSDGLTIGQRTQTVVGFAPDGSPLWAGTSIPISGFTNAMGLTCLDDGTVYFSAHVVGTYQFPPHTVNEGGQQAYVIGRMSAFPSSLPLLLAAPALSAWPVPASDAASVLNPSTQRIPVGLWTSTGQFVREFTLQPGINLLPMVDLAPGVFTLLSANGARSLLVKE